MENMISTYGSKKKIIHIVEALEGGIVEFLRLLILDSRLDFIIIHGNRIDVKLLPPEFCQQNVKLTSWKESQREINLWKDIKSYRELSKIIKSLELTPHIDVVHLHSSKAGFIGRLFFFLNKINIPVFTRQMGLLLFVKIFLNLKFCFLSLSSGESLI